MTHPALRPRKWSEFQHYTNRKPTWIKLHRSLLDDYAFARLSLESRATAPMLWLIASEDTAGNIEYDPECLAFRLRTTAEVIERVCTELVNAGFFQWVEADLLAGCYHDASLEREKETEREKEGETETESRRLARLAVFEHWQKTMNHHRSRLDKKRRAKINAALDMGYTTDDLIRAIDGCRASPFHMGDNDRSVRYDELTLILRDAGHIDRFIRHAEQPASRLGRSGNRTKAAANSWLESGETTK